jgi:hypothetical protein
VEKNKINIYSYIIRKPYTKKVSFDFYLKDVAGFPRMK